MRVEGNKITIEMGEWISLSPGGAAAPEQFEGPLEIIVDGLPEPAAEPTPKEEPQA
jgi:hypothetical protein